jgi:adenosylhomocysteinase
MRAKGLGANVIVTEIDHVKAIEAVMDGFHVMTMDEAAPIGDIFITVTGCENVIARQHFKVMKNGAILCNAGHFNVEISLPDLESLSKDIKEYRKNIMGYTLDDGRILYLLGEGRLVNLACGDGHPAEIMDMSFAVQALSALYILENKGKLEPKVFDIPEEIDEKIAKMKLESLGITIDTLTEEQAKYLESWSF